MQLSEIFEWLELLGCYVAAGSYGWLLVGMSRSDYRDRKSGPINVVSAASLGNRTLPVPIRTRIYMLYIFFIIF